MREQKHVLQKIIRIGTLISAAGLCLPSGIANAAAEAENVIQIYTDASPEKRPTHINITIGDGKAPQEASDANTIHVAIGELSTKQPTVIKIYSGCADTNPKNTVQMDTTQTKRQTVQTLSDGARKPLSNAVVLPSNTERVPMLQREGKSLSQTAPAVRPIRIIDEKPVQRTNAAVPSATVYTDVKPVQTRSVVTESKGAAPAADTVIRREQPAASAKDVVSRRMDIPKVNTAQPVKPVSLDTLYMADRFNQPAPKWTYTVFTMLDKDGLLLPDKDMNMNSLSRREGAILTARAYNIYHRHHEAQSGANGSEAGRFSPSAFPCITQLMDEFAPEVEALGYSSLPQLTDPKVKIAHDKDLQVHGEIRYSYANNEGSPKYTWVDNRLRARIYLDKKINDHWTAHAMAEYDKSHISKDTAESRAISRGSHDGDVRFSRFYVEGSYTWWDIPFTIEAGKTYAYLADGNVLDSDFHGVKVTAKPDVDTSVSAGIGKVNDTENTQFLEAWQRQKRWDYMLGWYHWNNYDNPTTITAAGSNYNVGNYRLGGMYLHSDKKDGSGAADSYVASVRFGQNFPWITHTYEFDLKYYNMAGNTYINHTMNGLGNYMNGFTGWGAMFYYTLYENLLFSLQYYDLKDKTTSEKSRTLWADLTWGF